jgi:predicted NUDIX family NTP pyrophosphohydrolase
MKTSAGLLMYRRRNSRLEFLLVHPGGPFWAKKDQGAWTIPKGEAEAGEDLLAAAKREFKEELGCAPVGEFFPLRPVKQKSGKLVHAWAFEGDCEASTVKSNTVTIEWPPRSGRKMDIPEVDRAEFFPLEAAVQKINPAQISFLEETQQKLQSR